MTNLDKSIIVFSKKHCILVNKHLADFYSLRLRKPFQGEQERNSITIYIAASEPNLVQIDPAQVTLDNRNMSAGIRVTTVDTRSVIDTDRQVELKHLTSSNSLEYHKLSMSITCYQLNMQFKEVLAVGKDD